MEIGGLRIDQQRLAILDDSQKLEIDVDEFVEAQCSSQHAKQCAALKKVEGQQLGDRVIASELFHFDRSLNQILQIVSHSIQQKIRLVAIKEAIYFEGKQ